VKVRRSIAGCMAAMACAVVCLVLSGVTGAVGRPYADLGEGTMGRFSWRAWVAPAGRGEAPRPPCIWIGLFGPSGRGDGLYHGSEGDSCGRPVDETPVTQVVSTGSGKRERSVFAGAFSMSVRRIRLDLVHNGSMTLRARTLGKRRAQHAEVDPFSYVVKGFTGPFCLRRIVGLDATGRTVSDSGPMPCEGS
jgi:hypothetical protein